MIAAMAMLAASLLLSAPRYRRPIAVVALTAAVPLGLFLVSLDQSIGVATERYSGLLGTCRDASARARFARVLVVRTVFVLMCLVMMLGGRSEACGPRGGLGSSHFCWGSKPRATCNATVGGTRAADRPRGGDRVQSK